MSEAHRIKPFAESDFVVTFYGECPQSTLIHGWENVLDHIDAEMGNLDESMPPEASVRSPCCELHDPDNWATLGSCYMNNDDERHTFSKAEFGYCVGVAIVRITEPSAANSHASLLAACEAAKSGLHDAMLGGDSRYAKLSRAYAQAVINELDAAIAEAHSQGGDVRPTC